jgi:hypothetical protein
MTQEGETVSEHTKYKRPPIVKAGDDSVRLGQMRQHPHVDCYVVAAENLHALEAERDQLKARNAALEQQVIAIDARLDASDVALARSEQQLSVMRNAITLLLNSNSNWAMSLDDENEKIVNDAINLMEMGNA